MRDSESKVMFIPTVGSEEELAQAAYLASLADSTPNGKLLGEIALRKAGGVLVPDGCRLVGQGSIEGALCGVDLSDRMIRKGSMTSIEAWLGDAQGYLDGRIRKIVSQILMRGGIAIVIADDSSDLGVICVKGASL